MTRDQALEILREAEATLPPEVLPHYERELKMLRPLRQGHTEGSVDGRFRINANPVREPVIGLALEDAARSLRRAIRQVAA